MRVPDPERARAFAAALGELEAELDWAGLGACYCEGDARGYFDAGRRASLVEVGLELGDDVAAALPAGGPGRSLYVGAALAELPPILAEHVVLEREVVWLNREGAELDELSRALATVGERLGLAMPEPTDAPIAQVPAASCDHLWLVSVLTDPEAFPALHDALYERVGCELATGRGDLAVERRRAEALVGALLERAAPPCVLTTTDEELQLVGPLVSARGWRLDVPGRGRLSALVGDVVRTCRLTASQAQV
jgi:hypothetical protein